MHIPFLLNWYSNPYQASIIVAKKLGFYKDEQIDLSILEPTNPSEVTKIIGEGLVPLGLKAMVHCYAAHGRGYPVKAIGTIFDEPPTGLISDKRKNIKTIGDMKGKCLGYVGEFGKVMIDELAREAGLSESDYQTVRTGMDASGAIISGEVDAAIGLSCFQQVEVEHAGIETNLLRIDEAANLGCCCFCSIVILGYEPFIKANPEVCQKFLVATRRGAEYVREYPKESFKLLTQFSPRLKSELYEKIFYHCLPFVSKDCLNVARDWRKVGSYAERLGILQCADDYQKIYTNEYFKEIEHV